MRHVGTLRSDFLSAAAGFKTTFGVGENPFLRMCSVTKNIMKAFLFCPHIHKEIALCCSPCLPASIQQHCMTEKSEWKETVFEWWDGITVVTKLQWIQTILQRVSYVTLACHTYHITSNEGSRATAIQRQYLKVENRFVCLQSINRLNINNSTAANSRCDPFCSDVEVGPLLCPSMAVSTRLTKCLPVRALLTGLMMGKSLSHTVSWIHYIWPHETAPKNGINPRWDQWSCTDGF